MRLRSDLVEKLDIDVGTINVAQWFARYELFVDTQSSKMKRMITIDLGSI